MGVRENMGAARNSPSANIAACPAAKSNNRAYCIFSEPYLQLENLNISYKGIDSVSIYRVHSTIRRSVLSQSSPYRNQSAD